MRCDHCQHDSPDTSLFCGMCGKSLYRPVLAEVTGPDVFQYLVENTPDGYFVMVEGQFPYMNAALPRMFAYPADEAFRITVTQVIHPQDWERLQRNVMANIEGRFNQAVEYTGVRRDGSTFPVEVRTAPIQYNGRLGIHGIIRDVTERKELEEQVLRMERVGVLARLASGIAHEFNNILGIIVGNADVALCEPGLSPVATAAVEQVRAASFRGADKVRFIQELGRLRADEHEFRPIDVGQVLRDALKLTRGRWQDDAERAGIHYDVAIETQAGLAVQGSDQDLRSVFMALVLNAIEAMPRGGSLLAQAAVEDGQVVVRLTDSGVGMAEDVRARVFDPFFSTKPGQTMGLGLGMAAGVVQRHHGTIEVESAPGKGTTFTVRLPVLPAGALLPRPAPVRAPSVSPRSARLLVIDDQPDLLQVVATILAQRGHRVDTAEGGRAGLERAQANAYDLVLTDLGMPDMSGWEVADTLRRLCPGVPVVLMTGWAAEIDDDRLARHTIARLLPKPFPKDRLLGLVDELLPVTNTSWD